MRILVFCGTRDAIERFDMQPDWEIIVNQFPLAQRNEIVRKFINNPNGKLAVDRCMIFGWGAPPDTFVLFDPSWPFGRDAPETKQAVGRRRVPFAHDLPNRVRKDPNIQNLRPKLSEDQQAIADGVKAAIRFHFGEDS